MEEPKQEPRIRIEAPPSEVRQVKVESSDSLPGFYWLLILLAFIFSCVGLYLAFIK